MIFYFAHHCGWKCYTHTHNCDGNAYRKFIVIFSLDGNVLGHAELHCTQANGVEIIYYGKLENVLWVRQDPMHFNMHV